MGEEERRDDHFSMMSWKLVGTGTCVDIKLGFFFNLSSSCLISYPVVWQHQYEIIIIPALLVGIFLIILGVIFWLFIRGKRAQQQSPGLQGKAQTGLDRGLGKMEIAEKWNPSLNGSYSRDLGPCSGGQGMGLLWNWERGELFPR